MESPDTAVSVPESVPTETHAVAPSLVGRAVAIFARPSQAWGGLEARAVWWFPFLLMLLANVVSQVILYDRAFVPMIQDQMQHQVEDGRMTSDQVDHIIDTYRHPKAKVLVIGSQVAIYAIIGFFLTAAFVWLSISFILGGRLSYRLALEIVSWSSLINLPVFAIMTVLSWVHESMRGVHIGFGILLPEPETPSRLLTSLGAFLDGIGPFAIWYFAVAVIGAAILSGKPRGRVAWAMGSLYLVMLVFVAALAALAVPAS